MTFTPPNQPQTPTRPMPSQKCRVMLVDDSLVVRGILRKILISDPDIQVVASVGNGKLAVEELDKNDIDAVILDIEMPVMDGITALPLLLQKKPNLVVLVASTLSQKNADISMKCLNLGAQDYIPKPTTQSFALDEGQFRRELIEKVKSITRTVKESKAQTDTPASPATQGAEGNATDQVQGSPQPGLFSPTQAAPHASTTGAQPTVRTPSGSNTLIPLLEQKPRALVIGCSTGGPQALAEIFRTIKTQINAPIFIAQHMPPMFTKSLADNLARVSGLAAQEGRHGEMVKPGTIYVSPGDYHMEVIPRGNDMFISLNQTPPENYCRPSANPLLRSVAKAYQGECLAAILTGLGADGSQGAADFVKAGGSVIAQDEATSVIYGMPAAVAKAGLCSGILPLHRISTTLVNIMNASNPRAGVPL